MEGNRSDQIINNLACPPSFMPNQKSNATLIKQSAEVNSNLYAMMKENALFLLELSSTSARKCELKVIFCNIF